jgi:hypothetical protein
MPRSLRPYPARTLVPDRSTVPILIALRAHFEPFAAAVEGGFRLFWTGFIWRGVVGGAGFL